MLELYRFALVDGTPIKEVTTFLPDTDPMIDKTDPRLVRIEGLKGKWFWFKTINFFGNDDPTNRTEWNPYKIPLGEKVTLITEEEFLQLSKGKV